MVQFSILNGKMAGSTWVARRFPVRIGRAPGAHLRLEEPGVWDHHAEIICQPRQGLFLKCAPDTLATVNTVPVREVLLRNGDTIDLGSARLQFWLAATRQRSLRYREWFTWALIAIVSMAQVALVYLLRFWE